MHGLINRAIEQFARSNYGEALWVAAATAAGADPRGFALMREYETELTGRLMRQLAVRLDRHPRELAEDIAAWICDVPSIRRLLRFAGGDFRAFVMALPELNGRAQMVVPGLYLPPLEVSPVQGGWLLRSGCARIWLHAVAGMLHAMADDYGVLAVVDVEDGAVRVLVPVEDFAEGRPFSISDPSVGSGRQGATIASVGGVRAARVGSAR